MTNERAVEILNLDLDILGQYGGETAEAYKMAIQALEAQPSEDCISRQAVIKNIKGWFDKIELNPDILIDSIVTLPSVTPRRDLAETSQDCISRQKALDCFEQTNTRQGAKYAIETLPSVKPKYTDEEIDKAQAVEQAYVDKMVELTVKETKRPKGHWIGHGEHCENLGVMPTGLGAYEWCSNCDCGIDVREWHRNHYNFCPNCGAEMGGGEDG